MQKKYRIKYTYSSRDDIRGMKKYILDNFKYRELSENFTKKIQQNLLLIAQGEGITFANGKGQKKAEIQKLREELEKCGSRLMEYRDCFEIMWKDRNSYSKTDPEATFMRMKEDHMLNGSGKCHYPMAPFLYRLGHEL